MNRRFKLGEVVILVDANKHRERIGSEVEIIAPLAVYSMDDGTEMEGYGVRYPGDPLNYCAKPQWLQKKPPKQRRPRLGSWAMCPFKPAGVKS
jgi:hypothetical protein